MNSLALDRLSLRTGVLCFALALASGALACTDDGTDAEDEVGDGDGDPGDGDGDPGDGDGDGALSHAADIQPIWDANCLAACHEPGGSAGAILDLSGDAHGSLVGVASTQAPGVNLVTANDSASSYLVAKLRGTQNEAGGSGATMPSGGSMLPEATLTMIEEWIDTGAAP